MIIETSKGGCDMEAVTYQNLVLALGDIYAGVVKLEINETFNNHGAISLVAMIDNKQRKKVLHESKEIFSVVYIKDKMPVPLFVGVITFQEIDTEGKVSYLKIYAKTITYFMDFSPMSRSFQNVKMTSHELIKEVMQSSPGSQCILHIPNVRIDELVLQYEETNWEFLKRFISRYHAQIRVESSDGMTKLEIGSGEPGKAPTGIINIPAESPKVPEQKTSSKAEGLSAVESTNGTSTGQVMSATEIDGKTPLKNGRTGVVKVARASNLTATADKAKVAVADKIAKPVLSADKKMDAVASESAAAKGKVMSAAISKSTMTKGKAMETSVVVPLDEIARGSMAKNAGSAVKSEPPKPVPKKPKQDSLCDWDKLPYSIDQDREQYNYLQINGMPKVNQYKGISYLIKTYDIVPLGFVHTFHQKLVYVSRIQRKIEDGILVNYYTLCVKEGLWCPQYFNRMITGTSIYGSVLASKRNRVQVHLGIDGKEKPDNAYWFPFSTVAASSDGSGWYCMPKDGEQVRIFFPEDKENDGYAITTLPAHNPTTPQSDDPMGNPAIKNISTPDGKEIKFTETGMVISTDGGNGQITLDNDGSIDISGVEKITMAATKQIIISAEQKIIVSAENKVSMISDAGGAITIESGKIDVAGTEIHQN